MSFGAEYRVLRRNFQKKCVAQKNGFQVTIFDKYEPGLQCSFGNAGAITPNYALPNATPGAFKNIPKWLFTKYSSILLLPR